MPGFGTPGIENLKPRINDELVNKLNAHEGDKNEIETPKGVYVNEKGEVEHRKTPAELMKDRLEMKENSN